MHFPALFSDQCLVEEDRFIRIIQNNYSGKLQQRMLEVHKPVRQKICQSEANTTGESARVSTPHTTRSTSAAYGKRLQPYRPLTMGHQSSARGGLVSAGGGEATGSKQLVSLNITPFSERREIMPTDEYRKSSQSEAGTDESEAVIQRENTYYPYGWPGKTNSKIGLRLSIESLSSLTPTITQFSEVRRASCDLKSEKSCLPPITRRSVSESSQSHDAASPAPSSLNTEKATCNTPPMVIGKQWQNLSHDAVELSSCTHKSSETASVRSKPGLATKDWRLPARKPAPTIGITSLQMTTDSSDVDSLDSEVKPQKATKGQTTCEGQTTCDAHPEDDSDYSVCLPLSSTCEIPASTPPLPKITCVVDDVIIRKPVISSDRPLSEVIKLRGDNYRGIVTDPYRLYYKYHGDMEIIDSRSYQMYARLQSKVQNKTK